MWTVPRAEHRRYCPPIRRTFLILLATFGCLRPNPAFDDAATAVATTLDTSAPPLTGATNAPTSGAMTSGSTTAWTTDSAPTGSATTGTTADVDTTASDTTTGAPLDCWGRPPDAWDSIDELLDGQLGILPSAPRITPDGLVLYYMAEVAGKKRPHRSERMSLDEAFTTGWLLAPWMQVDFGIDHPNLLRDETEIVLAGRPGLDDELLVAVLSDNGWAAPVPMMAPTINTPGSETIATFNADATRMIFQRDGGAFNSYLMTNVWHFFEASRAADAPPGAPFAAPQEVTLPGISDDPDYAHIFVCPTLSPDGLHLFFGSSFPVALDANNENSALGVFSTRRGALDQPWGASVEHQPLRADGWETCPSSVSADGCTLVFHRFTRNQDPGDYRIFLARRGQG